MKLRKIIGLFVVMLLGVLLVSCGGKDERIKIGILQFANATALDEAREGFIMVLEEHGLDEKEVKITVENANADFSIMGQQAKTLVRNNDLVLGIATPAAQALANEVREQDLDIPVLFTAVTDPVDAGLIESNENPGGNITGTNDMNPISEQIALAKELLPEATKLGIIFSSSERNSEIQADEATLVAESLGMEVIIEKIATVNNLQQAATSLASKVDIMYIPTDNTISDSIAILDPILRNAMIPAIAGEEGMVPHIPALTIGINYLELGKVTGEQAVRILKDGVLPKDIPSVGLTNFDLVINKEALTEIEITIPESILNRAKDK